MKRTPIGRKTPLRRSASSTLRGDPTKWQRRSRDNAAARPGRAPNSTLPARGPVGARKRAAADLVRPLVWARDGGACRYPHDHPLMVKVACSAPHPDRRTDCHTCEHKLRWEADPRNRGYLALCHVIPVDLAGPLAWDPDNLFVGCDAGNTWQETDTGDAIAVGVHGRMGDQVHEGRTLT